MIQPSTLTFLRDLKKKNDRDWFNANKPKYLQAQANVIEFLDELMGKMNAHDHIEIPIGKRNLYRIYNDVRFSKDKTPYNPRFAGYIKRVKPFYRGGYYFWISPGASRVACGFGHPSPDDLKRIRVDIEDNHSEWLKILRSKSIWSTFGEMKGDKVKTAPQGFSKDHTAIDLLRFKQYWFTRSFSDQEVLDKNFVVTVNKTFKAIRPFFDYASEVLTTDLNGESIII